MTSLFQRIGGEAAIKATVVKLYEKILTDELLAPYFENIDVQKLRHSQTAFVTMAFGGSNHYAGKDIRAAHANAVENGLDEQHFNAVAGHLAAAMRELDVDEALISEALSIVATTKSDVLNR